MSRIIPIEVKKEWEELYMSGVSLNKIGLQSDYSRQTVTRYLNSLGRKSEIFFIPESTKKKWPKLYKDGVGMKKIGLMSGCSYVPVRRYLNSLGIKTDEYFISESTKNEWPKMYKSGLSLMLIGIKSSCSYTTVAKYLNGIGIKTDGVFIPESIKKKWPKLYIGGLSGNEISKKFNCEDSTVFNYLKKNKIKIRTSREGFLNYIATNSDGYGKKGYSINEGGYIVNKRGGKNHNKFMHRIIMEEHIGRPLTQKEVVHHIDGNKQNNDISNLQIFSSVGEHTKFHAKLRKEKKLKQSNNDVI